MPGIRKRKEMTEADPNYKAVDRASAPTFDIGASMDSWRFNSIPKITIAAINGPTVGLGCEITLHCDIRIAAESARWGEVFVLRGMVPDTGAGTWLLPRIVGLSKALELVCSGEIIDAQEMLRIGLVDRVVPSEKLLPAAKEMAKKFLKASPLAVQMAKQLIYRGLERTALEHLRDNRIALDLITNTEDHTEGVRSFLEKRAPQWKRR
jgi:enoyl-CoA hydratase/carnithine racemase